MTELPPVNSSVEPAGSPAPSAPETLLESSRRAERRLLAKCFADPIGSLTAIEAASLAPGDLAGDDHRYILESVLHCARTEGRGDPEAVGWQLDRTGRLADAGGREVLLGLARLAADPEVLGSSAGEIVAEVRNFASVRRLRERLAAASRELEANPGTNAFETGNRLAEELVQLNRRQVSRRDATSRQGQFRDVAEDLTTEAGRPDAMPEGAIPTGFPRFDTTLGGVLKLGRLTLLLGPSDVGKTTLTTQVLTHAALALRPSGGAVAEIFQEGTARELMRRAVQLRAAIRSGATPRAETLAAAGQDLDSCRLFIDDGAWHADEISPHVARLKEAGVSLFIHESAEHLGALGTDPSDPLDGLEYKLRRLKHVARSNHVAVLLTASVDVATIPQVLQALRNRQRLTDVAMALLPRPATGPAADPMLRDLVVFHNHLGPLDQLTLRLRPDLGGVMELEAGNGR